MYKHIISYRFYENLKPGSSISPVKKLEIIVDEKIYSDGPGIWKTKCKNFISSKTGINPEQVLEDSNFGIKFIGIEGEKSKLKNDETSNDKSRNTKSVEELEMEREQERLNREANEVELKKMANKIVDFYNSIKPYLKYIIPIYSISFIVCLFIDAFISYVLFVPVAILLWAHYTKSR
jgi:hypothetical protein